MVLKIRLARFGRKRQPFYNIVLAQARTARDSRPMEVLGTYDPTPHHNTYEGISQDHVARKAHKNVQLDRTRIKYWIGVGAQPTDTVWRILSMAGMLEPKPRSEPKMKWPPPPPSKEGEGEAAPKEDQ